MNIVMSFWIWCFVCFGCIGCNVMAYVETMDKKNLIRIETSVVSYKDTEVVGKYNQAFRECMCPRYKYKWERIQT